MSSATVATNRPARPETGGRFSFVTRCEFGPPQRHQTGAVQRPPACSTVHCGEGDLDRRHPLMKLKRHLPTLNVLALVVVLLMVVGPPAYAAGKKLITGADVQDSSLTGADVQNGSLASADLDGALEETLNSTRDTLADIEFDVVERLNGYEVANLRGYFLKPGTSVKTHYKDNGADRVVPVPTGSIGADGSFSSGSTSFGFGCEATDVYFEAVTPSDRVVRSRVITKGPGCP